jgi:hypothetical protein
MGSGELMLNERQFQGYEFTTGTSKDPHFDIEKHITTVSRPSPAHPSVTEFLGSVSITRDTGPERRQEYINRNEASNYEHFTQTEEDGQRRWVGGNFDAPVNKVSWVGATTKNPRAIFGLMGLAMEGTRHWGAIHADNNLSAEGAQLSRSMASKYGIKPHPKNPDMEDNLGSYGDEHTRSGREQRRLVAASQARNLHENLTSTYGGSINNAHVASSSEVAGAANALLARRDKKPKDARHKESPGQTQFPGMSG